MRDHELRDRIPLLLDRDLDPEERVELERLVRKDPACWRRLREIQSTWTLLDAFDGVQSTSTATRSLMDRARAEHAAETRGRLVRLVVGWAAAAAIFLAVFLGLPSHQPSPNPQDATLSNVSRDFQLYVASSYDFEDF
jgi:anti-sigma factor RsiW